MTGWNRREFRPDDLAGSVAAQVGLFFNRIHCMNRTLGAEFAK